MTTSCEIVYWRDIPAQVRSRSARQRVSLPLDDRFQQGIDEAAMRADKSNAGDYLEAWRTSGPLEREGDPQAAAAALAAEIEAAYPPERLRRIVANGGVE